MYIHSKNNDTRQVYMDNALNFKKIDENIFDVYYNHQYLVTGKCVPNMIFMTDKCTPELTRMISEPKTIKQFQRTTYYYSLVNQNS